MFAIVFEVQPDEGKTDEYLGLAKRLKPLLEATDGFLSNERFTSLRREGWILAISMWRDEKSVVRWRSQSEHHAVQLHGRAVVFSDYHLRVGEVTTDSEAGAKPLAQHRFDETEVGAAKALALTEIVAADGTLVARDADSLAAILALDLRDPALTDHDLFESITNPGKLMLLTAWRTADHSARWTPESMPGLRHRRIRNIRDYSMFDRREAFQYCPVVQKKGAQVPRVASDA